MAMKSNAAIGRLMVQPNPSRSHYAWLESVGAGQFRRLFDGLADFFFGRASSDSHIYEWIQELRDVREAATGVPVRSLTEEDGLGLQGQRGELVLAVRCTEALRLLA